MIKFLVYRYLDFNSDGKVTLVEAKAGLQKLLPLGSINIEKVKKLFKNLIIFYLKIFTLKESFFFI